MVMKDKLVKNHHYGIYYKVRNFFIAFAAVGCLGLAIAVPTYIGIQNHKEAQLLAEGEEDENSGENLEGLESYQEE